MSDKPFRVVHMDHTHGRGSFTSGSEALDSYFRERVSQDIRRMVTACFVALSMDGRVAGYYTLASASIFLGDLPQHLVKKLPRYPSVPAVRMGRLAVDQAFKGQGLGGALLADALTRVISSEIAAYALVADAKDDESADFYRHHGFLEMVDKPLTLFLPLATVPGFDKKRGPRPP
jgi:GNAT superfamily N-acetyltransferase